MEGGTVGSVDIGPEEKRDVHIKVYVEPSVAKAIQKHQHQKAIYSTSEAVRELIIRGLDTE